MNEPPSIFLSHTWADKEFARRLASDLTRVGAKVWIDEAELKLGDSLIEKIREGIDQVDFLAVILSPASVASAWVQKEVDIAMNQEINGRTVKVLPLMYQQCSLPWFLEGKLYADFTAPGSYDAAFGQIINKLGLTQTGSRKLALNQKLPNIAAQYPNRIHLQLHVRSRYFAAHDPSILAEFVFDTGAELTVITRELSRRLQLPPSGAVVNLQGTAGQILWFIESEMLVRLGDSLELLPCCYPTEHGDNIEENLLGMHGLIDKYEMAVSDERVAFREKAG